MTELSLSTLVHNLSPSATIEMQARAKKLKDQGVSVISLNAGEPDFETPQEIIEATKQALDNGVNRYTAVRGSDELIKAMQQKFARDQKVHYEPMQVLSTAGSKAAIAMALEAVAGPGDEVIILAPYWVSYTAQIGLTGAQSVVVSASSAEEYLPDVNKIKAAITSRTKAIILNSPNNPTGVVLDEQKLRDIMSLFVGTGVWVISDEIYEHLTFDHAKHFSPAAFSQDARERTVVISGLSKGYAMTGWRVGVVGGPLALIQAMTKLQQQRYSCISGVTQAAAAYALQNPPSLQDDIEKMCSAYEGRRNTVLKLVAELKDVKFVKPEGAFYFFLDFSEWIGKVHRGVKIENDMDLALRLLSEAHVATVAGSAFGTPGCLRVSIASSIENITEGVKRIANWLS